MKALRALESHSSLGSGVLVASPQLLLKIIFDVGAAHISQAGVEIESEAHSSLEGWTRQVDMRAASGSSSWWKFWYRDLQQPPRVETGRAGEPESPWLSSCFLQPLYNITASCIFPMQSCHASGRVSSPHTSGLR